MDFEQVFALGIIRLVSTQNSNILTLIHVQICPCQGVRNAGFSENFTYVLNTCSTKGLLLILYYVFNNSYFL